MSKRIRRYRYRLAMKIYPWWTQDGVDAVKWRAHLKRRELGLAICTEQWHPISPESTDREP